MAQQPEFNIIISPELFERIKPAADGTKSIIVRAQGDESVYAVRLQLDETTEAQVAQLERQAEQAAAAGDAQASLRHRERVRQVAETVLVRRSPA